jgi:hypothetical protein
MDNENTAQMSKKEKKDYLKNLKSTKEGSDKKLRLFLSIGIGIVILGALAGLYLLSNQQASNTKELGESIKVDPTNGRTHIEVGTKGTGYSSNPPTSGPHYNAAGFGPIECKVFDSEVADEGVIHNLEHGGIWISYKDKTNKELKNKLEEIAKANTKIVLSPRVANDSNIAVAAWGRLLKLEEFDEAKIVDFIKLYKNSPNAPEPIAGCGTTHSQ